MGSVQPNGFGDRVQRICKLCKIDGENIPKTFLNFRCARKPLKRIEIDYRTRRESLVVETTKLTDSNFHNLSTRTRNGALVEITRRVSNSSS